mmetsp:Transcript_5360/g.17879  ORF Transcript_5360/g.17879 Transcript_5360/m.17879 type:complete len:320 (+) Transcript_5360:1509-2468(+)
MAFARAPSTLQAEKVMGPTGGRNRPNSLIRNSSAELHAQLGVSMHAPRLVHTWQALLISTKVSKRSPPSTSPHSNCMPLRSLGTHEPVVASMLLNTQVQVALDSHALWAMKPRQLRSMPMACCRRLPRGPHLVKLWLRTCCVSRVQMTREASLGWRGSCFLVQAPEHLLASLASLTRHSSSIILMVWPTSEYSEGSRANSSLSSTAPDTMHAPKSTYHSHPPVHSAISLNAHSPAAPISTLRGPERHWSSPKDTCRSRKWSSASHEVTQMGHPSPISARYSSSSTSQPSPHEVGSCSKHASMALYQSLSAAHAPRPSPG